MKIRSGLVSNSSTSSFVVTGHTVEEVESFLKGLTEFEAKYMPNSHWKFDYFTQCTEPTEMTGKEVKKEIDDWIGLPSNINDLMDDDETFVQFCGTDDNSIPGHVFDVIETGLNARRFHF